MAKGTSDIMTNAPKTVDEYIGGFSPEIQTLLQAVRATVLRAVPDGEERISYRMPAVFQGGVVVYYAAFKKHISLFPPVRDARVKAQVSAFAGAKGNLQFPYSQPIPHELIAAVVSARLKANLAKVGEHAPTRSAKPSKRSSAREGEV